MNGLPLENDNVIFYEMMTHPALFSHPRPARVAILGDEADGILSEVLKHSSVTDVWCVTKNNISVADSRVKYPAENSLSWIQW